MLEGHNNGHWKGPYEDRCHPCNIRFDVVVKLGTSAYDVPAIVQGKLAGRGGNTSVNKWSQTSWIELDGNDNHVNGTIDNRSASGTQTNLWRETNGSPSKQTETSNKNSSSKEQGITNTFATSQNRGFIKILTEYVNVTHEQLDSLQKKYDRDFQQFGYWYHKEKSGELRIGCGREYGEGRFCC